MNSSWETVKSWSECKGIFDSFPVVQQLFMNSITPALQWNLSSFTFGALPFCLGLSAGFDFPGVLFWSLFILAKSGPTTTTALAFSYFSPLR